MKTGNKNISTITGLIIPVEWDRNGHVVKIAIATFDENQYFIEETVLKGDLHSRIGERVVVKGAIKKVKNKNSISVTNIVQCDQSDINDESNFLHDL